MQTINVFYEHVREEADRPSYETAGAAGADLRAYLKGGLGHPLHDDIWGDDTDVPYLFLDPGKRVIVPTGIRVAIPSGFELQIRSRSGATARDGLIVLNSPGTIDSDYRGEIGVILFNAGSTNIVVKHGERIAQAVLAPVFKAIYKPARHGLPEAEGNRSGGFGSTGK